MIRRQQICKNFTDFIIEEVFEPLSELVSDKNFNSNVVILQIKKEPTKFVNILLDSITCNILEYYQNRNKDLSISPSKKRKVKKHEQLLEEQEEELIQIEILGKAVFKYFSLYEEYERIKQGILHHHQQQQNYIKTRPPKKQKIQPTPSLLIPILEETPELIKLFHSFHITVLKQLLKIIHQIITEVYGIKLCEDLINQVNSKSYPYFLYEYFLRHPSSENINRQLENLKCMNINVYTWIITNCIDIKTNTDNDES